MGCKATYFKFGTGPFPTESFNVGIPHEYNSRHSRVGPSIQRWALHLPRYPSTPHIRAPSSATLHPQPSTLNPAPSILVFQPCTRNPQPCTLNPQPSTLHPEP